MATADTQTAPPTNVTATPAEPTPEEGNWLERFVAARGRERRQSKEAKLARRNTRNREKIALRREQWAAKCERQAERRAFRAERWGSKIAAVRTVAPQVGDWLLDWIPILAPMGVAWIGQIGYAKDTLDWPIPAALAFAAAWEIVTLSCSRKYDTARRMGDSGVVYRFLMWAFAGGAGFMNYWHVTPDLLEPNQKGVSFGVMSVSGLIMMEARAWLRHRKMQREKGRVPGKRPKFGIVRWIRFSSTTFTAWSMAIRLELETVREAWNMALRVDSKFRALRDSEAKVIVTAKPSTWSKWISARRDQRRRAMLFVEDDVLRRRQLQEQFAGGGQVTSQVTGQVTSQVTPPPGGQVTVAPAGQTTRRAIAAQVTSPGNGSLRQVTRQVTAAGKSPSRRDDELMPELREIVRNPDYLDSGGVPKVKPIAEKLRIGRDRCRLLLDRLDLRPLDAKAG